MTLNMETYGFQPEQSSADAVGIPARVTAVHRERYEVICAYGETYAKLKTKEYYGGDEPFPTTGDFVLINYIAGSDSQIIRTLPRKTFFSRRDPTPGRGEQAVAANFDFVFIMQSLNHDFNQGRMERYLTLARQSGAVPIIVLTKLDLVDDVISYIAAAKTIAADTDVIAVSSKTGEGLDSLRQYIRPQTTSVFLGSSGVGKSSLVNALAGETIMAVNAIREDDSKGRHTTTHRQLIMLSNGAMVIDTPGMRELGMWDVSVGLGEAFADVEQYLGLCRFNDCKHETEPGCAVREAIARGDLSETRWQHYLTLKREAKYTDNKIAYLRRKQEKFKDIAAKNREIKKERKKQKRGYFDD